MSVPQNQAYINQSWSCILALTQGVHCCCGWVTPFINSNFDFKGFFAPNYTTLTTALAIPLQSSWDLNILLVNNSTAANGCKQLFKLC